MKTLNLLLMLIIGTFILGCATPPGRLSEMDFISKKIDIDLPISKVYHQFREGFRYCGSSSGGVVFVTHHGIPDCMHQEDGSILCDMYIEGFSGGKSDWVLGKVELVPDDSKTVAALYVQTHTANKNSILKSWEMFLLGRHKEVCP